MEPQETPEPKKTKWRKLFVDKLLDLAIVILGITIAFQLESWKRASDERSLERYYMESMAADVRKDIAELEGNLEDLRKDKVLEIMVWKQIRNGTLSPDTLSNAIFHIMGFDTFDPNNNTYESLVSGNGLSTFSDRATRALVTEYYAKYVGIRRYEDVYTKVILDVFAYFNTAVDFADRKVIDTSILKRTETKNFMLIIEAQLNDGIGKYEDALENARELLARIEGNLK